MPLPVRAIVARLTQAGHEAWCVGGAVRDAILGIPTTDFDIATSALPEQVQALFGRTVPIGIRFGTVGVIGEDDVMREVTTFRADLETDGRHAVVQYGVSLDDDLSRRDFTMNAIAWQPERALWRDPFDGYRDIRARLLRAVGDPSRRFREDYLRILRAVRFAARFDLAIDPSTRAAAIAHADGLAGLSAERVLDEWKKGLAHTSDLAQLAELWHLLGASRIWLPELRSRAEIGALMLPTLADPRDLVLLTAALCTRPAAVLRRFKASAAAIARADAIERAPEAPTSATPRAVREWLARTTTASDDLRRLARMRAGADPAWGAEFDAIRARGDATTRGQLAVTGADLLRAGLRPGPLLGRILDQLLAEVIDEPARNHAEWLVARARSLDA